MNIRYSILALLLGSQISLAEQAPGAESQAQANTLPTTFTPAVDISDALTEKLDRQLEESTSTQPLPKAQWVSATFPPSVSVPREPAQTGT